MKIALPHLVRCESLALPNALHIVFMPRHIPLPFSLQPPTLSCWFSLSRRALVALRKPNALYKTPIHSLSPRLFAQTHLDHREEMPRVWSLNLITANTSFLAIFIFTSLT